MRAVPALISRRGSVRQLAPTPGTLSGGPARHPLPLANPPHTHLHISLSNACSLGHPRETPAKRVSAPVRSVSADASVHEPRPRCRNRIVRVAVGAHPPPPAGASGTPCPARDDVTAPSAGADRSEPLSFAHRGRDGSSVTSGHRERPAQTRSTWSGPVDKSNGTPDRPLNHLHRPSASRTTDRSARLSPPSTCSNNPAYFAEQLTATPRRAKPSDPGNLVATSRRDVAQ